MGNEITDTDELAEAEWDGSSEPSDQTADISATKGQAGEKIEFHVQMRGYTMREMDNLIVEAAARLLVGNHNEKTIAKAVEERCIALLNAKATAVLDGVTTAIIDQPLTPTFGEKKPVTMRELLGLYGREYLEARVNYEGKPETSSYNTRPRMQWFVEKYFDNRFKLEIEAATSKVVSEVHKSIRSAHDAFLEQEKLRLHEALKKLTK